ncbi:MAG: DUF4476 domain-containing protein [Pseudomonadota bacterium]
MRLLPALLLALALVPATAFAQADEAAALQRALDDLEVVQSLVEGKMTTVTRAQALAQLAQARQEIMEAQQALLRVPPAVPVVVVTDDGRGHDHHDSHGRDDDRGRDHHDGRGEGRDAQVSVGVVLGLGPDPAFAGPPPVPPPPPLPSAMSPASFASLKAAIQLESFSDGKLRVLAEALRGRMLSVAQARELLPLYSFSSDRVEAAVTMYPALVDPQDFYQLYGSFDFDSDKEEVRKRLGL